MTLWDLPGPAHYLQTVFDALREGRNLILAHPAQTAENLTNAVERQLADEGWSIGGHVYAADWGVPRSVTQLLDQLFDCLELDQGRTARRTVALLRQTLRPGQIILVSGIAQNAWPLWKELLLEYESASRAVSAFDRPLLLVIVEGFCLTQLPCDAVALQVLPWQNVLGELDMQLYAATRLRASRREDFRAKLLTRMLAQLALWDFQLADYLLEQDFTRWFNPMLMLRTAYDELGWPAVSMSLDWSSGGMMQFDGIELVHPALLARDIAATPQLNMRLWSAQAAMLLPALELQRQKLVQRMKPLVQLPMRFNDENISDLNDLEIGELTHLARVKRLPPNIQKQAEKWRQLRNKLSHLDPLLPVEAFDPELLGGNSSTRLRT